MKSKLRKIVIGEMHYLYTIKDSYVRKAKGVEGEWTTTVRIFKEGHKNTPLEFVFISKDEYASGNPLKTSYSVVRNEEIHEFNVYRPWFIELLVQEGIAIGWNGKEKLRIDKGMGLLKKMNFEISGMLPKGD